MNSTPPDPESSLPLYQRIAETLRWQIATGVLRPGEALPSARSAAEAWKANRHTVRRAYQELVRAGLATSRPRGRTVIAASAAGAAAAAPAPAPALPGASAAPGPEAFVAQVLVAARLHHGLGPRELARRILERAGPGPPGPAELAVVECNHYQASTLAEQVAARWDVRATPRVLSELDELPPAPVVSTLFHFEELRDRWPRRAGEVRFLPLVTDPALAREVERRVAAGRTRRLTILSSRDHLESENLSRSLYPLLPPGEYEHVLATPDEGTVVQHAERTDGVVLVAPRLWDGTPPAARAHPAVVPIDYRFDAVDLEMLGLGLGWADSVAVSG